MEEKRALPCARNNAHGNEVSLPCVFLVRTTKQCLCRVYFLGTRQIKSGKFSPRVKVCAGSDGARGKGPSTWP
jgi:hypothetical protein